MTMMMMMVMMMMMKMMMMMMMMKCIYHGTPTPSLEGCDQVKCQEKEKQPNLQVLPVQNQNVK